MERERRRSRLAGPDGRRQPDLRGERLQHRGPAPASARSPPSRSSRAVLAKGLPLDGELADEVAQGMKEWALENGASHYTHWFQPLTGITAEKHDSFYIAGRRRHGDRRVLRQGADPPGARRVVVPERRTALDVRGPRLQRLGSDLAGLHPREPERRPALHPRRLRLLHRRGPRPQDAAAALDGRRLRRGGQGPDACSATTTSPTSSRASDPSRSTS